MKLEEVISNLLTLQKILSKGTDPVFLNALALGIEASKREEFNRENPDFVIVGLLPGETEEET